jgi:hypothetical protein
VYLKLRYLVHYIKIVKLLRTHIHPSATGRIQETFNANAAVRAAKTDSSVTKLLVRTNKTRSQTVS